VETSSVETAKTAHGYPGSQSAIHSLLVSKAAGRDWNLQQIKCHEIVTRISSQILLNWIGFKPGLNIRFIINSTGFSVYRPFSDSLNIAVKRGDTENLCPFIFPIFKALT
jgi:hypothetical protein